MNDKIFKNKTTASLIAIFCSIIWGSAFPVLKTSFELLNITPADVSKKLYFAGLRFLLASVILFLIIKFILKSDLKPNVDELPILGFLGVLQTSLQYYFFYIGLGNTSGMKASILISAGTFITIILAHFIYHDDKIDKKKVIGSIVGILGIIIINIEKLPLDLSFHLKGEGFLIFSGFTSAFATFLAKKLSRNIDPFKITAYQMLIGSMILLFLGRGNTLSFNTQTILLLIYAAFISSIGFGLWYTLLKYNKAGEITLYKFVIPVSGTTLSAIFLKNESFNLNILIALILVSIGIIFVNLDGRKKDG